MQEICGHHAHSVEQVLGGARSEILLDHFAVFLSEELHLCFQQACPVITEVIEIAVDPAQVQRGFESLATGLVGSVGKDFFDHADLRREVPADVREEGC